MAAANTDLVRKSARRWVGQIGAGGVSDAVVTTIPLASTTNLPTDTAVTLVIDRVDANGKTTASQEETITGVVSGSNIISAIRGVEGTAQAHNAGAVVELLFSNKIWNDFCTSFLVAHGQDGSHAAGITLTTPVIASFYQDAGKTKLMTTPNTASDTLAAIAATQTLTNKRVTPRVVTATDATSITPNTDNANTTYQANTQGAGTLTINADAGTPTNGQIWILWVKATSAQTASFNSGANGYIPMGAALPTTFAAGKNVKSIFQFDIGTGKWGHLQTNTEA